MSSRVLDIGGRLCSIEGVSAVQIDSDMVTVELAGHHKSVIDQVHVLLDSVNEQRTVTFVFPNAQKTDPEIVAMIDGLPEVE